MAAMKLFALALVGLAACGSSSVNGDDDDTTPTGCAPRAGGPYWLEEGQAVTAQVTCEGPVGLAEAGLVIADLPAGASFDAATGTLTWTPGLDQAAVWQLQVTTAIAGEHATLTIGVADAFDAEGNVPPLDPATYTHEYGLPVFFLTWHSDDPGFCVDSGDRDYAPADLVIAGTTYAGGQLRCRGAASLNFPKKSFTVKLDDAQLLAGIPGFEGRKRVVLTQTFDDNSYLRTRLAYWMWDTMDAAHLQLAQGSAVVFVDGEYWGLYQLTDHVDDELMERMGLDKNGNLYKSYNHEGNLKAVHNDGSPKGDLSEGYELKEGDPLLQFDDLAELLTWVTSSSDGDFAAQLDTRLVSDDFVDWYVFATSITAQDSYAKNSYLYHDPADPAGRWRYVPWDMNESWGQDWQSFRLAFDEEGRLTGWPIMANGVWQRMAGIPALAARIDTRQNQLLDTLVPEAAVQATIDAMVAEIEPAARRDERKWAQAYRSWSWWSSRQDFNDFAGEIAYVKQWVSDRWAYLATIY